jgi:hypothetical protein
MNTGQLELRHWQDAYLRTDRFDQNSMLARSKVLNRAASGYHSPSSWPIWNGRC